MNPEWKEMVNESGFVRDSSLRSEWPAMAR